MDHPASPPALSKALAQTQSACPIDAVSAALQDYVWTRSDFLGRGSYGCVYLAVPREQEGRRVAVKIVETSSEDSHWKREFALLTRLRHHNIVKLLNYYLPPTKIPGQSAQTSNAVLVFPAAHLDLKRYLDLRCTEHLTEPVAKTVCQQMLAGLAYLHTEGVVHRDLKPSNVLIMIRCVGISMWHCAISALPDGCRILLLRIAMPLLSSRRRATVLRKWSHALSSMMVSVHLPWTCGLSGVLCWMWWSPSVWQDTDPPHTR